MLLLSARRSAVGVGVAMMLTAMAAIADAAAAQPNRPVMAQHAAPFHGAAPVFQNAPVQRVAPHVVMPPATRPVYPNASRPIGVMPTFTQPQHNNNFQAASPSVQHVNPSLPLNNQAHCGRISRSTVRAPSLRTSRPT